MNRPEFDKWIDCLDDAFVGRVPKGFDEAKNTWFTNLRGFSVGAFRLAIRDLIRLERFPVLAQSVSACREHEPEKAEGYLINHDFCYKPIESPRMLCGCTECHPEFWCKMENCTWPVASRMKPMAGVERSLEYCVEHTDRAHPPYNGGGLTKCSA